MNKYLVAAMAVVVLNISSKGFAAVDESAKDWQVRSLKGITLVRYGVVFDPDNHLTKTVSSGLSGIGVTLKSVNVKLDSDNPLSPKEARLKVVVDYREKDKSWVGLYVQQRSKLDRNPAVTFDAETYKIGTLCENASAASEVKNLCDQFSRDFNRSNGK